MTRVLQQPDIERSNGIAVAQDSNTLYLVDNRPTMCGYSKIWACDLDDAGSPFNQRFVIDSAEGRGGDGFDSQRVPAKRPLRGSVKL